MSSPVSLRVVGALANFRSAIAFRHFRTSRVPGVERRVEYATEAPAM